MQSDNPAAQTFSVHYLIIFSLFQTSFHVDETIIPQHTECEMISWLLACGEAEGCYATVINMQIGGNGGSSSVKIAHFQGN